MSKKLNNEDKWEFIHRLDSIAIKKQKEEIERLKAEVERLRKEGEAMYPNLGKGWSHNAKEGKPSV